MIAVGWSPFGSYSDLISKRTPPSASRLRVAYLIDIGSVEGVEEDETPQGSLTAIPAEFSTTVVNTTLADLLGAEYAIDVRVDPADPARADILVGSQTRPMGYAFANVDYDKSEAGDGPRNRCPGASRPRPVNA